MSIQSKSKGTILGDAVISTDRAIQDYHKIQNGNRGGSI